MNRPLFTLALIGTLALASVQAATDGEVEARRVALELAGAFTNDGFKLRDGVCQGTLEPGKSRLVQVNLYAGNEYWFSLAGSAAAKKLNVTVFDETGKLVETEPYQEGVTAAAGFSPDASGPYYVRIELVEGAASPFCLVYSYK